MRWLALTGAILLVAGCTTRAPAPVVDRTPPPVRAVTPVPAQAGFHTVKKGETLYSIALEYGHDYRDVAAWNNIQNPGIIAIGQQLRVSPPRVEAPAQSEALAPVAEAKPVTSPGMVEVRPLGDAAPAGLPPTDAQTGLAPVPASSANLKRGPKGGKLPYSEAAATELQKVNEPAKVALAKPDPGLAQEPAPAEVNDADGIEWAWPYSGRLLTGFSDASNKGIDLAGNSGDPVVAAAAGKVLYTGNNVRGYGNLVIVKHSNTYLSAYAHNSKILVKENQNVSRGQKIAELGASDADQPKLHFEIRRQGKPVDPMKYLPQR